MNKVTGRIYSYDVLRLLAILAVVMVHTSGQFIIAEPSLSLDYISCNILTALSRFAVPVFVMISGALMLNEKKELENKKIFRSAISFFILIIIWSLLFSVGYNVLKPMLKNEPFSLDAFIHTIIIGGDYHIWYLYMIVGLYLITPILRLFVKLKHKRLIKYLLILSVTVSITVPTVNSIANIFLDSNDIILQFVKQFRMSLITEYLTYYVLGWYLTSFELKKPHRLVLYISGLLGLAATVVATQLSLKEPGRLTTTFHNNNMLNVFIFSVAVFVLVLTLCKGKDLSRFKKPLVALSNLSFGVYLIHGFYIFAFEFVTASIPSDLLKTAVIFAGTTVLSYVTVFIMSKIPLVKLLIRG